MLISSHEGLLPRLYAQFNSHCRTKLGNSGIPVKNSGNSSVIPKKASHCGRLCLAAWHDAKSPEQL